ncbi:hypothetical protein GQ55_9G187700 [Panicum hallii var. hallii]|uniref:Uncharacterized protein n=1 Tax=Panicum hallii var. hallii TaxID=1504633 RepID=A0A2T7C4T1_9POAL|nr:hypothetical protein GQ55_9G187700 [Panicum hallii var. hallii]
MIYRSPLPEWCEDIPYRKYGLAITYFYKKYIAAMNVNSPGWNQDIYTWKFTREKGIVEDKKGEAAARILRATWFCSTCLRGRVPKAQKFIRMTVLCARTSSSKCCHRTRSVIENCFLRT